MAMQMRELREKKRQLVRAYLDERELKRVTAAHADELETAPKTPRGKAQRQRRARTRCR